MSIFDPSIRIDRGLYAKLKEAAGKKGYSSVEEFAVHLFEQAIAEAEEPPSDDEVRNRLKGLGYIE